MSLKKLSSRGGDYREINGGAHRKAASTVGQPSFVRRIGLWDVGPREVRNKHGRSGHPAELRRDLKAHSERRRAAYSNYLSELQAIVGANEEDRFHDGSCDPLRQDRDVHSGTLSVLRFCWRKIHATVRVEFHAEYVTVTSILDFSLAPFEGYQSIARGASSGAEVRATAEKRLAALKRMYDRGGWPASDGKAADDRRRALNQALPDFQAKLWAMFEDEVLNGHIEGRRILEEAFGEVFADFRGTITGSHAGWSALNDKAREDRMQGVTTYAPRRNRNRQMQHARPSEALIRGALRRLWPAIEFDESLCNYEFTAGAFLNGRAIYVSALGPQPNEGANSDAWNAVHYHIHSFTDDEWQIGRLVERINTLGTLRLAATMDVKSLSEASALVDDTLALIEAGAAQLQSAISASKSAKGDAIDDGTASAEKKLENINNLMVDVQSKVVDLDFIVSGDISVRLQRSEYYLAQFGREARALREKRIEGYQKYQEFVARRLNGVFRYFEFLRRRLTEIHESRAALVRQYSSLKISTVTSEIGRIQEIGDVALIGILIPYYVGMMIGLVFNLKEKPGGAAWILAVATFFAAVLIYRRRRNDWQQKDGWAKLWTVSAAFLAYVLMMWTAYWIEPHAGPALDRMSAGIHSLLTSVGLAMPD